MSKDRIRYAAIPALALIASNPGLTLAEAIDSHSTPAVKRLCIAALNASLEAGSCQEQRAEAEAKIRTGWNPRSKR